MAKWEIREKKDGSVALYRDRRWVSDHPTADAASGSFRRRVERGDSVIYVASDGYRTQQGRRRGWRQ